MLKKPTEIKFLDEIPKKFIKLDVKNGNYIHFTSKPYEILYKSIEKYGFVAPLELNLTKIIRFNKNFDFNEYLRQQKRLAYNYMHETFPLQILYACVTTAIKKYAEQYWEDVDETLELARHIRYEPTESKAVKSFVEYMKKVCNYDMLYRVYGETVNHSPELEFPIRRLDLGVITTEKEISDNVEANGAILAPWVDGSLLTDRRAVPPIYIVGIRINDKLAYVSATTDLKQFFYDVIMGKENEELYNMMRNNEYKFVPLETYDGNEKWITIERKIREYKLGRNE